MQVSHSFALGIAACACAVALTSAAVEPQNVTARPTRPLDQRVMLRNARLRNQTAGAPARGHIRTLIERITVFYDRPRPPPSEKVGSNTPAPRLERGGQRKPGSGCASRGW